MRKIFLFLIFILLGKLLFSQQYLNKTFTINGISYPPTTIIPTDSGYLCSSFSAINIYLLDSSANLKWHKQYNLLWPAGMGTLNKTADGNYYSAGTMQLGGLYEKPYFVKFNNVFDTLFTKVLLTDSTATRTPLIYDSFRSNNGDFVFMGSDEQDSTGNVFTNNYSNGLFIKTDSAGIIKNHKTIGSVIESDGFETGIIIGGFNYFLGYTFSYAPVSVIGYDRLDGWVVKTDLQGNEIASVSFGNPNLYDFEFKFAQKHNNILVSAISSGTIKHSSGAVFLSSKILLLDQGINIVKEIRLKESLLIGDTMTRSFINQIAEDTKNNLFVLMRDNKFNVTAYTNRNTTSVVKLDSLYNICYYRNYTHLGGQFNSENSNTIATTIDGGYVFGGYVNDNTLSPPLQSWLVKTDSLGCDGFNSCNDTALVCQILQAPDTACKNDTAWIHVKFKGRSAPYFIYTNTALALDSMYYPYTLPQWIDTLVPYVPTVLGMQQVIIRVNDPWDWQQSDTVQIFVKDCGAGNIEESWYPKKVEIFPNPATTELRVRMRAGSGNKEYSITIYDMQGKVVKQILSKQNENVIDIKGLEEGIYGIRIVGGNVDVSDRFVKLK